jgi:hypothetical protein
MVLETELKEINKIEFAKKKESLQDRQRTYNVTLRRVRFTVIVVEKQ